MVVRMVVFNPIAVLEEARTGCRLVVTKVLRCLMTQELGEGQKLMGNQVHLIL